MSTEIRHWADIAPVYVPVRAYNFKELCCIYNVSDKTMTAWLKPFREQIGEQLGRCYTIAQVRVIFNRLGRPEVE